MSNGETDVEKRIRILENACAAHNVEFRALLMSSEDHEDRMREIEKLLPALRAVMWVGSALGLSVIGLIWAMITGQVTLIF